MKMKQRGWGVKEKKHAVGAKVTQTCTGLQTKRFRTEPLSVVNANFGKFEGIFRDGANAVLIQGAHEHEAKGMVT